MPPKHEDQLREYVVNSRLKEAWEEDIYRQQLIKFNEKQQRELQIRELSRRGVRNKRREELSELCATLDREAKAIRQRGYDTTVAALLDLFFIMMLCCQVAAKAGLLGKGVRMVFGVDHHAILDFLRMKMKSPPKKISELPTLQFDVLFKDDNTLNKEAIGKSLIASNGEKISDEMRAQLQATIEQGVELWLASRHYKRNPDVPGGFVTDDSKETPLTQKKFEQLCLDPVHGIGRFFVNGFPLDHEFTHRPETPRMGR